MLKTYFKLNKTKLLRMILIMGVVLSIVFALAFLLLVFLNKESFVSLKYALLLFAYVVVISNCISLCFVSMFFWWSYRSQTISLKEYNLKMQKTYDKFNFKLSMYVPQAATELAYLCMETKRADCKVLIARTVDYSKYLRKTIYRIDIIPTDITKKNKEVILHPSEWRNLTSESLEQIIQHVVSGK